MKKLSILAVIFFLFYLAETASIGKNGAVRKCYKKVKKSVSSNSNSNSGNGGNVKMSCKSLITEIANTADVTEETKPSGDSESHNSNNDSNDENSDDDGQNTVKIKYTDNLTIPKGTVLTNNEACVTAIYNVNKLLKQASSSFSFEQSCDKEMDIQAFDKGLTDLKINIYNYIEEAMDKCGNSKVWSGAKLHQACRVLSKTGQTVCHTLVDDTYEKYDHKCLKNATFTDMWEYSKWLWERLSTVNNGCYLKQLYDYKCKPSKDVIVSMGSNSYSLRLMCESAKNSCEWPGSYEGDNEVIKCLSNSIKKSKNTALEILKKNGYVCEGTNELPSGSVVTEVVENSDDEEPIGGANGSSSSSSSSSNGTPVIVNDKANTNANANTNNNNVVNVNTGINTDSDKKNMVSSGSEPWTNTNQIVGTIFIALFALLF